MTEVMNFKKKYTKAETIRSYVKYVLRKGTDFEKTQLVRSLDIKLAIHNRKMIVVE